MSRKNRRRRPKAHSQETHAIRRALSRFDLELTATDLAAIIRAIQGGRAKHIDDTSNRVGRFLITFHNDVQAVACYDRHRKQITTFLTVDMVPGAKGKS